MFHSKKYLYSFHFGSGSFGAETITLTPKYHNNPNVNLSEYMGMILGPQNQMSPILINIKVIILILCVKQEKI